MAQRKDMPGLDEEMRTPTPREQHLAELADKNKSVVPQCYDIINKNVKARRVIYDFTGRAVAIMPGETKRGILVHPSMVGQFRQGDLELIASVGG